MAKIPFNVKFKPQIESGEYKIETRSGKNVRIICWDKIGVPIVALVGDADDIITYNRDGTTGLQMSLPSDLFLITPEPELTEFEKAVKDLCWKVGMGEVVYKDDIIKKTAAELLDLARKELREELQTHEDHVDSFVGSAISSAYERGKAEALKDLPRWENIRNFAYSWTSENKTFYNDTLGQLFHKGKRLFIGDLEKLPGFND